MEREPTLVERVKLRLEDHPISAGILLIALGVAALGSLFGNVASIRSFLSPPVRVLEPQVDYRGASAEEEVLVRVPISNRRDRPILLTNIGYTAIRRGYDREGRASCPADPRTTDTFGLIPTDTAGVYRLKFWAGPDDESRGYSIVAREGTVSHTLQSNNVELITIRLSFGGPGAFSQFLLSLDLEFDDSRDVDLDPILVTLERRC